MWAQMAQSVFFGPSTHNLNASLAYDVNRMPGAFFVRIQFLSKDGTALKVPKGVLPQNLRTRPARFSVATEGRTPTQAIRTNFIAIAAANPGVNQWPQRSNRFANR
jgi:hypothetical protein